MPVDSSQEQQGNPRILLFSNRNIFDPLVWRCSFQEFEKLLQEIDDVDVLAPKPTKWYPHGRRVAARVGEFAALPLNPGIPSISIDRDYDMFFTVCERVSELLHLKALKGLRDRCKKSVCWIMEFYVKDIPVYKSCLEVLAQFDYVVFMFVANEPFKAYLKGQSQFLPAGIDTLRFCPYPNPPARSIDVLSIGRRAPATHQALLKMAEDDGKFYVYDTIDSLRAYNLEEHRILMANMAKRSRYFIVSPGKFDKPEETGGLSEFGNRYVESAAPGCIMLGMRPSNNPEFEKIFNWPDAVIEVPFTSDEIVSVIRELDKDPERQMKVRRKNITQSLLHHDWAYRWESILEMVGMQPLPKLQARKRALKELAAAVEQDFIQHEMSGVH
jgi:hypothetical protein